MTTPAEAADPLLVWRDRFPIVNRTNYLISNSLGAMPAEVGDELRVYAETWATRGVRAWEEGWWSLVADLGDEVAPLIGAGPGEVVFQPGVTLAHAIVFSAFDFRAAVCRRPRVVTDAMHFPSILYLLEGTGAEVVTVPSTDGIGVDTGRLVEAIDDRTAFVAISHVLFRSSYIHEVEAIAAQSRAVGALTIVDGYQAAGCLPVDVRSLDIDVYIGGCLKWLCGGPSAAFIWVRPELVPRMAPRLTGWMSHERPFAFEPQLARRGDAWRFLTGTPPIPALHAARPGLRILQSIGIGAVRAKSIRQTDRLIRLAEAEGFRVNAPREPARRGGTVAVDVPHGLEVSRTLKARDIVCDYRPGAGIRLSPHFYTRDDELDSAIGTIAEILCDSDWTDHDEHGTRPVVT